MEQQSSQPLICPSHTTHYIAIFAVGAILGAGVAFVYGAGSYQKGFEAAKKLVAETPMGAALISPAEIMAVSGTVTAVNGSSVTIKMQAMSPFDDANLLERTINVTGGTKIVKITMPDPTEMQAQMEAFVKATQAGKTPASIPAPTQPKEETIAISAIKVGDTVTATAAENIKSAKSFTATEVRVQ
jgi:hypothetical protein